MEKYEGIEKAIKENDIKGLREIIGSICYTCRDFSDGEFDESIQYIKSQGIDIFDSLDDKPLISAQKEEYIDDDFTRAVYELKRNFCDERIEDLKKIGKSLYGSVSSAELNSNKEENIKVANIKKRDDWTFENEERNNRSPKSSSHQKRKVWPIILVAGTIIVAIVGVLALILSLK